MGITYIFYDKALKTQGLRDSGAVPVRARWGLPAAWYTIIAVGFTCIFQGYGIMSPSTFDGLTFFFDYAAIFIFVGIFLVWKLLKRTAFVRPSEADLHRGTRELDAYSIECEEELENRKQTLLERAIDVSFVDSRNASAANRFCRECSDRGCSDLKCPVSYEGGPWRNGLACGLVLAVY